MNPQRVQLMNTLRTLEMRVESIPIDGPLTPHADLVAIDSLMAQHDSVLALLGGEPSSEDWAQLERINHHAAEGLAICRNI